MTKGKSVVDMAKALQQVAPDSTISQEEMPWVSQQEVLPSATIDSSQFEAAYAAKAALSQHVTLATNAVRAFKTVEMQHEYEPFVQQLRNIRLPATRVAIGNQKIEIPGEITSYANGVAQNNAVGLLYTLLGKKATGELYKLCSLAGQDHKPTLWLALKLYLETKQAYVYTIRHAPDLIAIVDGMDLSKLTLANDGLKELFGDVIYTELQNIARSNELSPFAIFVILFHQIVEHETASRQPPRATSTWDALLEAPND